MTVIANRYDFVFLFDVDNGNPNGDPDSDNQPRLELDTGLGLVTDVCLKRKIRNYVSMGYEGQEGRSIYVRDGSVLSDTHAASVKAVGGEDAKGKGKDKEKDKAAEARSHLLKHHFDARMFGAVMVGDTDLGKARGPVQLTFSRSIEPITTQQHAITRCAATNEDEKKKANQTTTPYGLYRTHGFISAPLAERTGATEADLALLWESLLNMFDHDRSAARGEMSARKLIVFKHAHRMGNAPAAKLFEAVAVKRVTDASLPAKGWQDYAIAVDRSALPSGVEIIEKL
jgi:CRISPR-associated protein Csd2